MAEAPLRPREHPRCRSHLRKPEKREPRRETAVWAGSIFHDAESRGPLPVALFDRACWSRERCLDLLVQSGTDYEVVYTSESFPGIRAAIAAGLAIGVLPQSTLTDQVRRLSESTLPHLGETPVVISRSLGGQSRLADSLTAIVTKVVRSLGPLV